MEIPESLAFEIIGRKELLIEVQRRQIQELADRLRRAEAAVVERTAEHAIGPGQ